ncbi:MAG: tetratricopeptide repeat protein [Terracidiphilus sp.]
MKQDLCAKIAILAVCLTATSCGTRQPKAAVPQGQANASNPPGLSQQAVEDIFEQSVKADIHKDYRTELQLCKQLADNKDVRGEMCLAKIYYGGFGVSVDRKESDKWERVVADHGDAFEQASMSTKAQFGPDPSDVTKHAKGHPLHPVEAVEWDRKAAEQGNANAQFDLSVLLFEHDGVAQDDVESYNWATLAIENTVWPSYMPGFIDAAGNMRSQLAQRMTRDQIAEGLKRAHEWQSKVSEATRVIQEADRTQKRLRGGKYFVPYSGPFGSGPK